TLRQTVARVPACLTAVMVLLAGFPRLECRCTSAERKPITSEDQASEAPHCCCGSDCCKSEAGGRCCFSKPDPGSPEAPPQGDQPSDRQGGLPDDPARLAVPPCEQDLAPPEVLTSTAAKVEVAQDLTPGGLLPAAPVVSPCPTRTSVHGFSAGA